MRGYSPWPSHFSHSDENDPNIYPFDVTPGERRTRETHNYSYDPFFIFGTRTETKAATDALYSDRIWQWDRDKAESCWDRHVGQRVSWRSTGPKKLSAFMTDYLGKKVKVTALAEGCNVSNGYPYWIIWFRDETPSK